MAVRAFHEAVPLPVTPRLGALLGAELARVNAAAPPDAEAARRLLATARAFLLSGEAVALPGLGRFTRAPAVTTDEGDALWARVAPDPELAGRWPGSTIEAADPFARRWMAFVTPRQAGDVPALPAGLPVTLLRGAEAGWPADILVPTPADPTDAYALPWLNDVAARISTALGTVWVAGVEGAARAVYLGTFEQGRHVSLFCEDAGKMFAELLPPEPHVPGAPRSTWPVLAAAARDLGTPAALAHRLALGESGGGVELDLVAGAVAAGGAASTPGMSLARALGFAWGSEQSPEVLLRAISRACARLARELAALTTREACADLLPLGVMMRIDEPELRVSVPGPGRVVLPARSRWVLAL